MRSRRHSMPSSLELLLDAICNAFGGIIFITMLLAISVPNSSQKLLESQKMYISPVEANRLEANWAEIMARYHQLKTDHERLQNFFARQFTPESQELINKSQHIQSQMNALQRYRKELAHQIQKAQDYQQQLERQQADLEKQLQQAQQKLVDLQQKLEKQIAQCTQTTRFPREHHSLKRSISLEIRFGKLYMWFRYDPGGNRIGLNTEEYVIVEETPQHILTQPKPYAGISLQTPDAETRIAQRLRPFPPERFFLDCAIWPDSFENFQRFKRFVVQQGYEYRLVLMKEGELLYDRGGTPIVQ